MKSSKVEPATFRFVAQHLNNCATAVPILRRPKTFLPQSEQEVKKSKEMPLEFWTGPEDSRRLRLPDFKTIGT